MSSDFGSGVVCASPEVLKPPHPKGVSTFSASSTVIIAGSEVAHFFRGFSRMTGSSYERLKPKHTYSKPHKVGNRIKAK